MYKARIKAVVFAKHLDPSDCLAFFDIFMRKLKRDFEVGGTEK